MYIPSYAPIFVLINSNQIIDLHRVYIRWYWKSKAVRNLFGIWVHKMCT